VAEVTFDLALGDETVASVTDNLATYKQAIAASFTDVSIEPNQVEIEVQAARRLRRLLAGVVLKVTITTYDIDSSQGIQDTLVSTDVDFGTVLTNELENNHGITTVVTIDAATIDTTILAQATSPPTTAPVVDDDAEEEATGGGSGAAIGGAVGGILVIAFLVFMYQKQKKSKDAAKAKVYSEPSGDVKTPAQAASAKPASVQPVVPVMEEESKEEEVAAEPVPAATAPAIKGPTAGILSPELSEAQLAEDDLDDDDLDDMGDMNVLGPPAFFGEWDDEEDETPPGTPQD